MVTRHESRHGPTILRRFVLASMPCAVFGIWNTGRHLRAEGMAAAGQTVFGDFVAGVGAFMPLLAVALAVSLAWGAVFARLRDRSLDPAWFLSAWLFVLLCPHDLPLAGVVAGVSFGVVFGLHVFGGTGRYLVSPALLGAVFIQLAYPGWFDGAAWLTSGQGGWPLFVGFEAGPFATTSEVLSLLGATILVYFGAASWRIIAGGVVGALLMASLPGALPLGYEHLLLGQLMFCLAFVATDPSAAATTRSGRWIYGALIGALTVLFRVADPAHPEGTLLACLAAALFAPLIDTLVIRLQVYRYSRRALP